MAAVLVAVGLVACSSASDVPSSWVYADDASAVIVQWTHHDGVLSGQLRTAELVGDEVSAEAASFEGTLADGQVTLHFPQGFGLSETLTGTVSEDQLTLTAAGDGGSLVEVPLHPGDVAAYNVAVNGLQDLAAEEGDRLAAQAEADQQEADRQAQQAAERRTLEQARASVADAEERVSEARRRLEGELEAAIATLEAEVAAADEDYDRDVVIPYELDVAVRYEYDAVRSELEQARGYLDDAAALISDPAASGGLSARIDGARADIDEVQRLADERWDQAVAVAARAGVEPEEP